MAKTLYLYDIIGDFFGIGAKEFIAELDAVPLAEEVTVRINSPGGRIDEAIAIHNALVRKRGTAPVTIEIDSVAASAASYVAMAGTTLGMADNAMLMIHRPYTIAMGNADDMRKTAEVLDKYQGIIRDGYTRRSKQDPDKVETWMVDETWFTAQEAKDNGFIDHINETSSIEANLEAVTSGVMQFLKIPPKLLDRNQSAASHPVSARSVKLAKRRLWIARQRSMS